MMSEHDNVRRDITVLQEAIRKSWSKMSGAQVTAAERDTVWTHLNTQVAELNAKFANLDALNFKHRQALSARIA
jgi:hypothetical protein